MLNRFLYWLKEFLWIIDEWIWIIRTSVRLDLIILFFVIKIYLILQQAVK